MHGREGKDVFDEKWAPDKSDDETKGSSLLYEAVDMGKPVTFKKPAWANTYTEEDLKLRDHREITAGHWWIDIGGKEFDTITDAEEIRDELLKALYGIWDHIKNGGDHGAETLDLDWFGFLPGKRESRRLLGDYVLKEQDLMGGTQFEDAVAFGGWAIDFEPGLRVRDQEPTTILNPEYQMKDVYQIPYRCLYSKNIKNLMLGGRAISVSHIASTSTMLNGTCSVVGQAIGTAGAMAVEKGILPRDVGSHIKELQQRLLKDDSYIPGFRNEDEEDIARKAEVSCSSHIEGGEAENVINGVARKVKENANAWVSREMDGEEWLSLTFKQTVRMRTIMLYFDPNLTTSMSITLLEGAQKKWISGIPHELVVDYDLELYDDSNLIHKEPVKGNYQRYRVHRLQEKISCDRIKLIVKATGGDRHARLFEIRVYDED
jgi:hypothetical protein